MPIVGNQEKYAGNVTTLNWIGPLPPDMIEKNLGYGSGRLAAGYFVLLMRELPELHEFELHGTTMRSGGKLGLPGKTAAADAARRKVHDEIIREYGNDGYRQLQRFALLSAAVKGNRRIAKVLPVTRHSATMAPDLQYPMGGGALQWSLTVPKPFLVAMCVDDKCTAYTKTMVLPIGDDVPSVQLIHNRTRLAQFLATA